jgi:hypothetical protein
MHNHLWRFNGTATPAIRPARRALLSILQTKRDTTGLDDRLLWDHFYCVNPHLTGRV